MATVHLTSTESAPTAAGTGAFADSWQLQAEVELFHIYFKHWRAAIFGAMTLVCMVGGILLYLTGNPTLWWWIALHCGAYLLQGLACLSYERSSPMADLVFARWLWVWVGLTAATGLISGALIFWMPADQLGLLLATVMISGTFAIAEVSASGHEKLVFAAVLSQASMTCIALLMHAHLPFAVIICVLFAGVVLHLGRELNRAMLGSIRQRLHAEQLAAELKLGQQQLLEAQHQQSVLRERQRVMQDMHDGLGSALSSSLVLLDRGELSVPQAAAVMRECVDDLRLVVDSLEPTSKDLSTLLGMLRYRLQHRIGAAGVRLRWQMADLPVLEWLEPSLALDLLRLMQEAIANVLKHAAASELALMVQHDDRFIELVVDDNGRGFDLDNAAAIGRGIRTMRSRAQRLAAQLSIVSEPAVGTTISVRLPIVKDSC